MTEQSLDLNEKEIREMRERFEKLRNGYLADPSTGRFRALIYGDFGSGKTKVCSTARAPIHIDEFDAQGLETLDEDIRSGRVIPCRYDNEQSSNPTQYKRWERDFAERKNSGYFDHIGTYVIDSATWFIIAMMNQIVFDKRSKRPDGIPAIQDYLIQQIAVRDILMMTTILPCDFIMTGHIDVTENEMGQIQTSLSAPKGLKNIIPTMFSEVYVTRVISSPSGVKYSLLTESDGIYKAETRIGQGKFSRLEEPDIKALLEKAGREHEDLKGVLS